MLDDQPANVLTRAVSSALRAERMWAVLIVLAILAVVPLLTDDFSLLNQMSRIAILATAALGLNLVLGFGGQYWLAQSALFALGAYVCGIGLVRWELSFWAAAPLATVSAGVVGVVIGLPGLRLGGFFLAMVTFFLAAIIPRLAEHFSEYTGGHNGLLGVPRPELLGLRFQPEHMYGLSFLLVVLVVFSMNNLVNSEWGRSFRLIADREVAAESLGVRVWHVKVVLFFLSGIVVGLAGAVWGPLNGLVHPSDFGFDFTIFLLAAVIIGGAGTIVGPLVGVTILRLFPQLSAEFSRYALLVYGGFLLLVVLFASQGLAPAARQLYSRLVRSARSLFGREIQEGRSTRGNPRIDVAGISGGVPSLRPRASVPSTGSDGPLLEVRRVSKQFGGVVALKDVSLSLERGSLVALIGPNGSGKTTLINIISGLYKADRGSVVIRGREVHRLSPHVIAASGVRRTFQTPMVVSNLSVIDNVLTGLGMPRTSLVAAAIGAPVLRHRERAERARAETILQLVGLGGLGDQTASSLAAGQLRFLELARAIIGEPHLIVLDEPTTGLSATETATIAGVIRSLLASGSGVVVAEHNMGFVMEHADLVTVLDGGAVVAAGTPRDIQSDEKVLRAYVGTRWDEHGAP